MATKKAIEEGFGVYYMWRSVPCNTADSGWVFAHGTEDDGYMNDPSNSGVYHLATVAEVRPEIMPHLNKPVGSAFYWDGAQFVPDPLGSPGNASAVH